MWYVPPDALKELQRMKHTAGWFLIIGLAAGIAIGYLVWGR